MRKLAMFGGAIWLTSGFAYAGDLDQALKDVLQVTPPDGTVSTLVYLQEQLDTDMVNRDMDLANASLATRHEVVVTELQMIAHNTQGPILTRLDALMDTGQVSDFESYWVANIIRVDATPNVIRQLANHPDVSRIYFNHGIELIDPVDVNVDAVGDEFEDPQAVEPGIEAVRAPEVWDMGITGAGVLVSTLDTGVDGSHPALAHRWRGLDSRYDGHPEWAFFDPVTNWDFPRDSGSHGTHTMGSVLGGAPGDQVGRYN